MPSVIDMPNILVDVAYELRRSKASLQEKTNPKNKYRAPALERGLLILEYLAKSGGKSLTQICETLKIPKTTTFTLLKHLVQLGFLSVQANGTYFATLKLFSLGMQVKYQMPNSAEVTHVLSQLRDQLKSTIHLASYVGNQSVLINKVEGPGGLQFLSYIGEMKPLHLSGAGKAILSFLPEDQFQAYLSFPLERRTEKSVVSSEEIYKYRKEIIDRGFAVDDEEGELGVYCIGVPVFTTDGVVWGGLSVSMLKSLIGEGAINGLIKTMLDAGQELSRIQGYSSNYPKTIA